MRWNRNEKRYFWGYIYGKERKRKGKLFKDCKTQFYNYALGERERNNNPSFDAVTKAVLRGIEKMDRDKIKDLLKNFAKRRLKNKNMNRRVSLLSLNSNDYPNICKVVKKLISTGMGKDLFN